MIIGDLYIIGISVHEPETDAPSVINRNRELTRSISFQFVSRLPGGTLKSSNPDAKSMYSSFRSRFHEPRNAKTSDPT
jgi:hypothetical protein